MKTNPILFFFLSTFLCFSQFSKTHYIPPIGGSDNQPIQNQYLYISCPSVTPIEARITSIGGGFIDVEVSRDNPYQQLIGTTLNSQIHVSEFNTGIILSNKGLLIEADDQVYVAVRVIATPQGFQAGGMVSKGQAALGKTFRIGSLVNTGIPAISNNHTTFISVLATENNTIVNFNDINAGVTFIHNPGLGNNIPSVTLDRGESYVLAVTGPNAANADGLIGTLVTSDKPIAVNCGSFAGTNGDNPNNLDLGFDQIVPVERVGTEYIFIRGNGIDLVERPIIVAHEDETEIYINGNLTPIATIDAGDYFAINGSNYSALGNMYVQTSKPVFAYQGLGGTIDQPNQELFFVPPLSCETPRIIDNVPFINLIGSIQYSGTVNLVTETGATLQFVINGTTYTLADLPAFNIEGPIAVTGNGNYESYSFDGLSGNVSVISSKSVYLSYYGSNSAATYGGFYSGFIFKPEVRFEAIDATVSDCIPNVSLGVNTVTAFDIFQWYFNDEPIAGATDATYNPTEPGYYYVKATISDCGSDISSDIFPVSECPDDLDSDGVNNNIDLDLDNDGIANCDESLGNLPINLTNLNGNTILLGNYSNSFTGATSTVDVITNNPTPFSGTNNGNFVLQTSEAETSSTSYKMEFANSISLKIEYPTTIASQNLLTSNADYIVRSSINQTFTVLNPTDQLLIDTNYDGIYENGVTEYSSFEIRFRLNSNQPLAAGTGTFSFQTYLTESFEIIQINTSENITKASFLIQASCVPLDSDADGFPNAIDNDSDNDGITDAVEAQGLTLINPAGIDANLDGIDDAFGSGLVVADSDGDDVPDYVDLDSDNDGIYDLIEAGHGLSDTNNDGRINGSGINFNTNGLANSLVGNGVFGQANYVIADSDSDGIPNYLDLDSDGDACNDVIEAGFSDPDNDGLLGNNTPNTDSNGLVINANNGYTNPNSDYLTSAPIEILTQPEAVAICESGSGFISISSNPIDEINWESSTDNLNWTTITEDGIFSNTSTNTLSIDNLTNDLNNLYVRAFLNKDGNSCGLFSDVIQITVNPLPVLDSSIVLVQCDDDTDGFTPYNLQQVSTLISDNFATETFTFFTNENAALTNDANFQIPNPTTYNANTQTIWVRVASAFDCVSVTSFTLNVAVTQIDPSFRLYYYECDDFLEVDNDDRDGISQFDISNALTEVENLLPTDEQFDIQFYRNQADALAETDVNGVSLAITDLNNYRNIGYPDFQAVWIRVESLFGGECYGIGPYLELTVESLPEVNDASFIVCDDDNDGSFAFETASIMNDIIDNQTDIIVEFFNANGNFMFNTLPNPFVTSNQTITARLTNTQTQVNSGPCFREANLTFTVDFTPTIGTVPDFIICDDENIGAYAFDVTGVDATIRDGQTDIIVEYFDQNNNPLPSPLPNPFVTETQIITAVVTNANNDTCSASKQIKFFVRPIPQFFPDETIYLCRTDNTSFITLQAALIVTDYDYTIEWFRNDTLIPNANGISLNVNQDGLYEVVATNEFGCVNSRFITIIYSEVAQIDSITVVDLAANNSISIAVSGVGEYLFSLNNIEGPYQSEPYFENLLPGIYEVFIKDVLNDCGIVSQTVAVIGIPKFITPNDDGFNDFFEVKGVNGVFNSESKIYIFDRYGKLIYQVIPGQTGWDGTFNGETLPATDYWYRIQLEDGREIKGHFSLIR
uniref:T9SS type B sorting domain-containing protein n=1 Tax=Flavobacterium sp. TaxID=239 RepID=UPI00404A74B5